MRALGIDICSGVTIRGKEGGRSVTPGEYGKKPGRGGWVRLGSPGCM